MFAGIGIGILFVVVGITWWKLGMARRLTPWALLLGSCVLSATAVAVIIQGALGTGAGFLAGLGSNLVAGLSGGMILLILGVVLAIYLYHGMHPKKGRFQASHNVAALVTPIVWIAAGGFFGAIVIRLATLAHHAGNVMNTLGR